MVRLIILITVLFSLNAFAGQNLKCLAPNAAHARVTSFFIVNVDGHQLGQTYLLNLDARQEDPSYQNAENTVISLHNGCDNYFETIFNSQELQLVLNNTSLTITGKFKYNYPATTEEYKETGKDYSVGEVEMICELSPLP